MKSGSMKTAKRMVKGSALLAGLAAAGVAFAAAPANATDVPTFLVNLNDSSNLGGPLDVTGPAVDLFPTIGNDLTLSDFVWNGTPTTTSVAGASATSFLFEYSFTVSTPQSANASVSQMAVSFSQPAQVSGLGEALYASAGPVNFGSASPIATGSTGAPGSSSGEVVLDAALSNITPYTLVVSGALTSIAFGPTGTGADLVGQITVSPVPLPGALAMFAAGLVGLAGAGRLRSRIGSKNVARSN